MPGILIIEDQHDIRLDMVEILELEGYSVYGAGDGETGLRMALHVRPDLILCDVCLPRMSGYDVYFRLREEGFTSPLIFMTAVVDPNLIEQRTQVSRRRVLIKPFRVEHVLNLIADELAAAQSTASLSRR
jgi:CheY-like chemotaxis protein